MTSQNVEAERLMGRRRTDVVPIDQPAELGYRCPACVYEVEIGNIGDGELDERLTWSEYEGFLWCEVCDVDWPSALCVDVRAAPDPERSWMRVGPEAAVRTFLETITAVLRRVEEARGAHIGRWRATKTAEVSTEPAGWPEWCVVSIDEPDDGPLVTCADSDAAEKVAAALREYDGRPDCPYIRGNTTKHCALAGRDAEMVQKARPLVERLGIEPEEIPKGSRWVINELVDVFGEPTTPERHLAGP